MGTTRTFQDMLNQYLPNELLKEELVKKDFLLSKVEKLDDWKGGALIVPFKAAGSSSIAAGSLTDTTDIAEASYVRGSISGHKEVWGSMVFNHRDLMEHGMVSEQNFLKILPGAIEDFTDYMRNVVSINLLNGAHFAILTADGTAGGAITVNRPDRFSIGQKITLVDSGTAAADYYVTAINMNTAVITVSATRGGAAANVSAYSVAQSAKVYNDGFDDAGTAFSSLRGALLAAANTSGGVAGDAQIAGVTKTAYPYLQAINVDGSSVSAANIMEKIFDALTTIRQIGRGNPTDVIMSYKNFASCLKVVEASKGSFNVSPGSQKASQYGWTELEVGSVTRGGLKLVAVQEADDDLIMFIDWRALSFHSNGFFQKRKAPDGKEYFESRATTGYKYILDMCLFGDLSVKRPSYCGVLYAIGYA